MSFVVDILTVKTMAILGTVAMVLLGYEAIIETATKKRLPFCRENMLAWAIAFYAAGYAYMLIASPEIERVQQIFRLLNFNLFVGLIGSQITGLEEANKVVLKKLGQFTRLLRNGTIRTDSSKRS